MPNPELDREKYARLQTELKAPFRPLRQFIYVSFGISGLIGAVVFLTQLMAGRQVAAALPNFALQSGLVALMVWLFRLERRANEKIVEREKQKFMSRNKGQQVELKTNENKENITKFRSPN
ncbi:MAG: DUF3493 domain-containing protein [Oscillatoriales cyanobacterium RM2_1_1]|nr:DUF3493 domain-containing protein [Oscillatoriales cyanobacterium SM2_3_0]NJO44184.1 DUF3493 domain-containing protein [Oscillatoriales cyanobacterium RM2_1_1]